MGNCCATKQGQKPYEVGQNTLKRATARNVESSSREFDDVLKADDEKMTAAGGRGHT